MSANYDVYIRDTSVSCSNLEYSSTSQQLTRGALYSNTIVNCGLQHFQLLDVTDNTYADLGNKKDER